MSGGEPLTHFWHCWRFADHHACAVALIEHQSAENDDLLIRLDRAERALKDAKPHDPPKRDPASTTTCGTTIRSTANLGPAAVTSPGFGFGKPAAPAG